MHVCALDSMSVEGFPVRVSARTTDQQDEGSLSKRPRRRLWLAFFVFLLVAAFIYWFLWGGGWRFDPEHGETFWHLIHNKAHWYLELVITGVEIILFDLLIGIIGWRFLLKPYIAERQKRAVEEDHALHGIEDHDGHTSEGDLERA
jgi:hypothetical protein